MRTSLDEFDHLEGITDGRGLISGSLDARPSAVADRRPRGRRGVSADLTAVRSPQKDAPMKHVLAAFAVLVAAPSSAQTLAQQPAQRGNPTNSPGVVQPIRPIPDNLSGGIAQLLAAGGRVVNVVDYGADPTARVKSCGAPLANALAALAALPNGGVLYWPRGFYACGTRIAWADKPISILGDGAGVTFLIFTDAAAGKAGIQVSQNSPFHVTQISGLQLQTNVDQPANNGITIAYKYSGSGALKRTVALADLIINGNDLNQHYWKNGVYCSGCLFGTIDKVAVTGKSENNPVAGISASNMNAGFHLNGYGLPAGDTQASTDLRISDSFVALGKYGIYISGDSEGQHIGGSTLLAVNYGLYLDDYAGSGDPTARTQMPGPYIVNSHCNAYFACVTSKGWQQLIINGNQFYKRNDGSGNWNAIELLNGTYPGPVTVGTINSQITGNQSIGFAFGHSRGGTATHVVLGSLAEGNVVQGEMPRWDDYFADLGGGTAVNVIAGNHGATSNALASAWFTGTNPSIIARENFPIVTPKDPGYVVLQNGIATPSVGSSVSEVFVLANPAAQNITDFRNGYVGQLITIVSNTAHNTIVAGPEIVLAGGASWTMTVGSTLMLRRESATRWREVARTRG